MHTQWVALGLCVSQPPSLVWLFPPAGDRPVLPLLSVSSDADYSDMALPDRSALCCPHSLPSSLRLPLAINSSGSHSADFPLKALDLGSQTLQNHLGICSSHFPGAELTQSIYMAVGPVMYIFSQCTQVTGRLPCPHTSLKNTWL